jgi:hypothetical protein
MASWIEKAKEFCSKHGFGSNGKYTHISRMFNSSDLTQLQISQYVCAYRPRGILSGFLVIHPELQYAVFLPPAASKLQPQRFHVRINSQIIEHGLIASAYLYNKQLIIEDLIYIDNTLVWQMHKFNERWTRLKKFVETEFRHDPFLQNGITLSCASYMSLNALVEPPEGKIVEFVPCDHGQKRLIWIPDKLSTASPAAIRHENSNTNKHVAKREAGMGPDVYSIYEDGTKLGTALVRTLVASRALRLAFSINHVDYVRVNTQFNKSFDKWEILDVVS